MKFTGPIISELTHIPALAAAGDFQLHRVNLVRAGCPATLLATRPNQMLGMPVVIACNREKHGYIKATNYYPQAVVVAGADRRSKLLAHSVLASWAWIEAEAARNVNADDAMGTNELSQKLSSALTQKLIGRPTSIPGQEMPWLMENYPFENYCIFNYRGDIFRQPYTFSNADRTVALNGPAQKVEEKFVNACAEVMPRAETGARYAFAPVHGNEQTSSRGAKNSELYTSIIRNWTNITEAANNYLTAVQHGLYAPMTPAFAPVALPKDGKVTGGQIVRALASMGVPPADFAIWSEGEQKKKIADPNVGRTRKSVEDSAKQKGFLKKSKPFGEVASTGY